MKPMKARKRIGRSPRMADKVKRTTYPMWTSVVRSASSAENCRPRPRPRLRRIRTVMTNQAMTPSAMWIA